MRSLAAALVACCAACSAPDVDAAPPANTAAKTADDPASMKGKEPAGQAAAAIADDVAWAVVGGVAVGGFVRPVGAVAAFDGSGRLFVVEQGGTIRVIKGGVVEPAPWLDVSKLLGADQGEQGLLGLAFHPKFKDNGRFFIAYTDAAERDAVAEFRAEFVVDKGQTKPSTSTPKKVWIAIDDPAGNHNGGHVLFGPDGQLWVGTGDGGGANDPWKNAQNPASLLGKMLRLDVDKEDARPTVWARGLRNPWRYDFDKQSGALWIGDVGQNRWEEIDVVEHAAQQRDLDFGWSDLEGRVCFRGACDGTGRVAAAVVYSHDFAHGGGCSVTGGVVKDGGFFYGDYCTGDVWRARLDGKTVKNQLVLKSGKHISSFGIDEAGVVWLVDHAGSLIPLQRKP